MRHPDPPVRVLHIIHELGDGGADHTLTRLVNASDPERFGHTILSLRRGRGYGRMRREVEVRYGGGDGVGPEAALKRLLSRRPFHVLHGWTPHASILAAQVSGVLGLPLVQRQPTNIEEEHRYEAAYTAAYWRELRLSYAAADAVIVPSPVLVDCTRRLCGVRNPVVISNSIDVDASPVWQQPTAPGRPFEMAFVGRLCRQKDPMTLIEATAYLPDSLDWRLCIFGDGYLREAVTARAHELGVSTRVCFQGFDRKWASAGVDVLVMPTRYEGMSNALLEAAAAGMPVVATDIPENRAVIESGRHGLLVPPGDAQALAGAIAALASDPDYARRLGAAARDHVRRFSPGAMVAAHESLYEELALAHGARRHAA